MCEYAGRIVETSAQFGVLAPCMWCGGVDAKVVAGKGPHHAGLKCEACGRHRGWLNRETIWRLFDENEGDVDMAEQRDNGGALFKNDRREKDSHPHYRGDITINGQKYWLSAWIKEGKRGKFMSLAVKPAEEKREDLPAPSVPSRPANAYAAARGLDDEIPF